LLGTVAAQRPGVRRFGIPLLVCILSLSGVAVAADALVTTEREELDHFVDDVTEERSERRIDAALEYVRADEIALRLSQNGQIQEFRAGESTELADAVRAALGVFDSSRQHLLQDAVRVDGDRATVTTRMGDSNYEQTVVYELVRRDDRWLVRAVRVL
jgi:hypothetical protein